MKNSHEVIDTVNENVPYYQKEVITTYTYTYRLGIKGNSEYRRLFHNIETSTLTIEEFAEEISAVTCEIEVFGNEMDLMLYDHIPNRFTTRLTIPYTTELENVADFTIYNNEDRKLLKDSIYNHLVKHFHFY